MLTEKQLENYTEVLLWGLSTARRGRFRKNDIVQIRLHAAALRLAEILYRKLIERGLNPVLQLAPTADMECSFFELSVPAQLTFVPPGAEPLARKLNGSIYLVAPESLTHLRHVPPQRINRAAVAARPLRRLLEAREALGEYSWTLGLLPTIELARQAGISTRQYAQQVVRACFLDSAQAVGRWQEIHRRAGEIKRWLDKLPVVQFHLESATSDLVITRGAERRWAGISGRNIPSFELFISPDWRGTRGTFHADQPSFRSGNLVRGAILEFKEGRVVAARAVEGERFLKKQLAMDPGACRLGEFSLTDRRFSQIDRFMANTLYDENYGGRYGNSHVALGSSYANTYAGDSRTLTPALKTKLGFNDSALHWDFVNTERKRVTAVMVGGARRVIYEDGEFAV